jgi:tRNA nucleotidyltransferase (CCA-adding enzyme)
VELFARRADRIFDNLDRLVHLGLDYAGDAYPAEQPQAQSDREQFDSYWHDEPAQPSTSAEYRFFYGNGQLEVSPNHDHSTLAGHIGIDPANHRGPVAVGHIAVNNNRATFEVASNVNVKALERVFKDYAKQVGWRWGGITNSDGEPISDEFAPKQTKTLNWLYERETDHLRLGRTSHADLLLADSVAASGRDATCVRGTIQARAGRAFVTPVVVDALPALFEWASDAGFTLYAGNDNIIKPLEDLQEGNLGANDESPFRPQPEERDPSGVFSCPECQRLFPDWQTYQKHRRDEESWGDPEEHSGFPDAPDLDAPLPAHYTEQQPNGISLGSVRPAVFPTAPVHGAARVDGWDPTGLEHGDMHYVGFWRGSPVAYATVRHEDEPRVLRLHSNVSGVEKWVLHKLMQHYPVLTIEGHDDLAREAGWCKSSSNTFKWAVGKTPSQTLAGPVPFIYDVEDDKLHVGHPGTRTSDIPGKFTPGGIVEGEYEPGGKVTIRSVTTVPYTIRHLVELWYYTHPEYEVKSVHLEDDSGKSKKLAHTRHLGYAIQAHVASFPAAEIANFALTHCGGRVYVVGGAVRDTVLDKVPKDVDLMVTGLPGEQVYETLKKLGPVKLTGKDFGVLRLAYKGDEVEVALPRRERSTGPRHQDFEVQSDHTMSVEEDLRRRDYTANAMAVDTLKGEFIDPYGGLADIREGKLSCVARNVLAEDPLRIVRGFVAHARFGLLPTPTTAELMRESAHTLTYLPAERIQHELDKLMAAEDPARAIRLAHQIGVLKWILPDVDDAFGYDQKNPHHAHDLGTHLMQVLGRMCEMTEDVDLRYAALLHDIGKPSSAWWHPAQGRCKFYKHIAKEDIVGLTEDGKPMTITAGTVCGLDHHEVGAQMAHQLLSSLKFPNDRRDRIVHIIRHHMWQPFETPKGARKFISRVGKDNVQDLLMFRVADQGGKGVTAQDPNRKPDGIQKQAGLVNRVLNEGQPTSQADLAINGHDLVNMGLQGPAIGKVFKYLTNSVIDNPELNTREALLALAQQHQL